MILERQYVIIFTRFSTCKNIGRENSMLKKRPILLLTAATITLATGGCAPDLADINIKEGIFIEMNKDYAIQTGETEINAQNIAEIKEKVWAAYVDKASADNARRHEFAEKSLKYGEVTMRYEIFTIGDAPEGGYPLYIAMHGGGSAPKELNDSQWEHMKIYYRNSVGTGVYVAVRGVRDTWNTHFNDESYPLYDRLIENLILFANVDPNRVYLMGFSAGGDGVYAIATRMTDRFAAANMSAGHPNGVSMKNLRNLPFAIQVGEKDTAYDRHIQAAIYDGKLAELEKEEGGYVHETFIHFEKPHNFYDNHPGRAAQKVIANIKAWLADGDHSAVDKNTNAVDWVSRFERNPYPEKIVWDLGTRASLREVKSFYWLRLNSPESEDSGIIKASLNKEANAVTVETSGLSDGFTILLNEEMLDIFSPVTMEVDGQKFSVTVRPSERCIVDTTLERGDRNYQFAAKIVLEQSGSSWTVVE